MKRLIIGTAGHVDHGKTQLTLALTGTNTDRLAEEQKRGITIEIGFAKLILPNGQIASIVDVPGHERFIKNMLVGASGVDVALLIVAADEGFMPQTQEHMEILSLLGVQNGIIVITKTDLVTKAWLEMVTEETRQRVQGTFLEDAPIIPVSAYTGQGVEKLKEDIMRLVARAPERVSDRPFRLPVDRVFSLSGYGVIATGTLVDGTIATGQNVMLYPQQKMVRVRELQSHDESVGSVSAGMRVAVNLSGVEKSALSRGAVLAEPNSMQLSSAIATIVTLNADAPYSVKNSSRLHFYQGTQELLCKVRLLQADELMPGESGYAQLFLSEPLAARGLDRFILRFYSPMTTIGGGVILDMEAAKRLKRNHPDIIGRLAALHAAPKSRVLQLVTDAGCSLVKKETLLPLSGLSASELDTALSSLIDSGDAVEIDGGLVAATVLQQTWEAIAATLTDYHAANPLSPGMHLGELREKAFAVPPKAADAVMDYFCKAGQLRLSGPNAALSSHEITFTPEQAAMQKALATLYAGYGFTPPTNGEVAAGFTQKSALYQQVFRRMCHDRELIPLTPQLAVHADYYEKAKALFISMFAEQKTVTLAEFRTALGVSRKYAQMYLEWFDRQKISKLVGEARVLLLS